MLIASIAAHNHTHLQKEPSRSTEVNSVGAPISKGDGEENDESVISSTPTSDKISDDSKQENQSVKVVISSEAKDAANKTGVEFTEGEKKQIQKLKSRDREVRTHEQAHAAAAGSLANGGPNFDLQRGPDGVLYAVGGHVNIDTSSVPGDPRATIARAQQVRRAALAPAQPSGQDRAVAEQASRTEAQARIELININAEEASDSSRKDATHEIEKGIAAASSEQVNKTEDPEKIIETHSKCAICGEQHSAESHVQGVEHQLQQTFGQHEKSTEVDKQIPLLELFV